jgi:hypothetical protein
MARAKRTGVESVELDKSTGEAVIRMTDGSERRMEPGVWNMRLTMIKSGLEMEMDGMRLTRKAPSCYTIIREEFGITGNKVKAYKEFCKQFKFTPKPEKIGLKVIDGGKG